MRTWRTRSNVDPGLSAAEDPFLVPGDRTALVIRNGVPERFYPPGLHSLPLGPAKVEVRLLSLDASRLPVFAPPDSRALKLPFERSFLHVDGELVGIVKPGRTNVEAAAPDIKAWEGVHPHQELDPRAPDSCLSEPLRACLPAAGMCCGSRMAA